MTQNVKYNNNNNNNNNLFCRAINSHLLVVPGVSTSLEGSQDESGIVA